MLRFGANLVRNAVNTAVAHAPSAPAWVTNNPLARTFGHALNENPIARTFLGTRPSAPLPDGVIIDWKSSKPTWFCHWFPMKETTPDGGDPTNNLFAPGGVLEKYDTVFGAASRDHELANNFRSFDSDAEDAGWAGHCNNASEVACLLQAPKRDVTYGGVKFSKEEISGLLVLISDTIASRVDFEGNRYNGNRRDDKTDPKPHVFLDVLKQWTAEDRPFVMDIDREAPVWNYPYDQVKATQTSTAPEGFDASSLPQGGRLRYYRFEVKGTGFEEDARDYRAWIHTSENGKTTSGWIENGDPKVNPDFLWRPHPIAGKWSGGAKTNPQVRAENVYEIYRRSIA